MHVYSPKLKVSNVVFLVNMIFFMKKKKKKVVNMITFRKNTWELENNFDITECWKQDFKPQQDQSEKR
jgi:hypothetical protein